MVTTNYRALIQNNWLDDLKYICEPTEYHEKRVTVHFICDRSILTEFTRHRTFSFSAESTRYCNYSKDKFNNEITFVIPCWMNLDEGTYKVISFKMIHDNKDLYYVDEVNSDSRLFLNYLITSEQQYLSLLEYGWKPQEARAVLPNALKTELVMTGFVSDWKHFFELRCASNAHPSAQELANPLREEFIKRGYIDK